MKTKQQIQADFSIYASYKQNFQLEFTNRN